MNEATKRILERVAKALDSIAGDYSKLMCDDGIYEAVLADLGTLPTGGELQQIAHCLTKLANRPCVCEVCGAEFEAVNNGKGGAKAVKFGAGQRFCSNKCKQKAYRERKK